MQINWRIHTKKAGGNCKEVMLNVDVETELAVVDIELINNVWIG